MSETSDAAARTYAVDPSRNVVLEASAGTGKTRVLVERYVNLLRAGVDPDHILAITFTRKAAAEMRDRIVERLRDASRRSEFDAARWRELKVRLGDIEISTIDAFCLSLLREFPLEADIDPGFDLADDTETPRLVAEALDQALRICRGVARDDEDVALVFAQLGERRLRTGLASLLERRLVAPAALHRYLSSGPRNLTASAVCTAAADRLRSTFERVPGGVRAFLGDGPVRHPQFAMLAEDVRRLCDGFDVHGFAARDSQAAFRSLVDRLRAYFLTQDGRPRGGRFAGTIFRAEDCDSETAWKRHRTAAAAMAPDIAENIRAFRRDLNVLLSRGVWRVFRIAIGQYEHALEARALLDFSGVLDRAIKLLKDMDEFAQSRFRLESRFRHVLVDEFQDTSRAQWDLVAQLVRNWGEGLGASSDALPSSIFIVGDRKQSIYGFRDAEVAVLDEAAGFVSALRTDGEPRRAISVSFRAVPAILAFVNDLCAAVEKAPQRRDAFRYDESDHFPLPPEAAAPVRAHPPLGIVAGESATEAADRIGEEIQRIVGHAIIRDRTTGLARTAEPADIAILFRSRDTHREFEKALERRGIPAYVYKGLGFFDADEVQDAVALLRFLADPVSNLRAAAFLRSRIVRLSDAALARLAPDISGALLAASPPAGAARFSDEDRRVFDRVRDDVARWLLLVDRMAPADLLREVLGRTGYAREMRGSRQRQAHENLKKLGAMVRRFQNRGYATLARVADHLADLAVGDESNAVIDAKDAVSLMTVHASKGLEFPVVFVANMNRGTGTARAPIRVVSDVGGQPSVAVADYQSEADADALARDLEETKRLLYVAITRARDRLYLSGVVTRDGFRPTRGSLGEVLPQPVRNLFVVASAGQPLTWTGAHHTHLFAVPRRDGAALEGEHVGGRTSVDASTA
jgi:ATP-dependent helicase/nuclease subunit A